MHNKTFAVYVFGREGSPSSFPKDTKYFKNEEELKVFEKTCKLNNEIYESFDLYNTKNIIWD